jgi:FAD/FMN-containing dehydrogenase
MSQGSPLPDVIADAARAFAGELLQPGVPGYEDARRVHNGLVDKRPSLIARCRGVADVIEAVNLARVTGLEVAVRGGGHNVAGRATVDGGLMIDLAPMQGVQVNPRARTVRAQGGVTWGAFNRETQVHGLACTGGIVSTTGIGGLTLGGGLGWLMGKYGLAVDNLMSAEVVTADGRLASASAEEHPDLFWAIRGGGGNFGIAASLEYRLHSIGQTVTGGVVAHPIARARDVLRLYRDVTAKAPDDLTAFAGLLHAPDATRLVGIVACHCGAPADAEAAVRPLKRFGSPLMDGLGPVSYGQMNSMLDAGYPRGALNYWKTNFLSALTDQAIDTLIDCYGACPTPMSQLLLEHVHGAVTRVGVADTAFAHRAEGYNFLILSQCLNPADVGRCRAWARETYAAMQPFMSAGRYVNYLDDDEAGDPVAAAYGPNHRRLQQIKAKYDPDNLFHLNQNIRPRP